MTPFHDRIEATLRNRALLPDGCGVLVAVSGGVDSMVLLSLLHGLSVARGWKLVVAHFNHQLRGRSSDADERFVKDAAMKLGLRLASSRGDVRQHAKRNGISIEMAARELRHRFLASTARKFRLNKIALAHHADDQVESFFLRLLRGTGGDGLGGMKWNNPSPADPRVELIRPFLDIPKSTITAFAASNGIRFRDDASNRDTDIQRNHVRHELLPRLRRQSGAAFDQRVLRVMEIARAESELAATLAGDWLTRSKDGNFEGLEVAVQRRVLLQQLRERGVEGGFDLIESLRLAADTPVEIRKHTYVSRNRAGVVSVAHKTSARVASDRKRTLRLTAKAGSFCFDGKAIRWGISRCSGIKTILREVGVECFDADKVGREILLRHWRAGDRFQPIGMQSAVKLQDWFTNRKIPRAQRHELLLATTKAGEIFWIEGKRIGERFKLTAQTRRRLVWRFSNAADQ